MTGGHLVLNPEDAPIQLDPTASVEINGRGNIYQNGEVVGAIQVTRVAEIERLIKDARAQFRFEGNQDLREPVEQPVVRPGYVEGSAVDPVRALLALVEATKSVSASGNLIRYHDPIMDRAVNVLGHVAA